MLTEEQQRFLLRYINNKGDFYKTVDSMGLDLAHVVNWQQVNAEFEAAFRSTKKDVIDHLKQENYMCALLKVNNALINGISQHTVQQKHKIGGDGESEFEVTRTTKELGVPSWAIREALQENSIVKAVQVLANEGVLPAPIARRILQSANKISHEVMQSFDISPDSDFINDKKAIALIKAAVLGANEE